MGYDIHIERREDEPGITLDEWRAAVGSAPGARVITATRVELGHGISQGVGPGDVELYFADDGQWTPVFRTGERDDGSIRIATRATALGQPAVLAFLRHVTSVLDAVVVGDEGEQYDPATGDALERN
ncbi:MAG TPA: hypothetical protein VM261_30760 [Kofleriaceae bacterium]|nr:hypothetical protein [Kofleriaceae bacterium]